MVSNLFLYGVTVQPGNRAVTDTLSPCFTEKRNVEKSSITVPVSDVFLITYQIHLDETKLTTLFDIF